MTYFKGSFYNVYFFNNILYFLIFCCLKINLINFLFCFTKFLIVLFCFFLDFTSRFTNRFFVILFYLLVYFQSHLLKTIFFLTQDLFHPQESYIIHLLAFLVLTFHFYFFPGFQKTNLQCTNFCQGRKF